jgi:hypothetical protein
MTTSDEIAAMTPEQATHALAEMSTALREKIPTGSPSTVAEARAQIEKLSLAKLEAGDVEANRQFKDLTKMLAESENRLDAALSDKPQPQFMEVTSPEHPLTTRDMMSAVEGLREAGLRDEVIRDLFAGRKVSAEERRLVEQFEAKRKGDASWRARVLANDHEAVRELTLMSIVLSSEVEESA